MTKSIKSFSLCIFIIIISLISAGCSYSLQSEAVGDRAFSNPTPSVLKINVGDNIQQAIDRAADGSEIVISSGRHLISKPVEINNRKNLSITGKGEVWVESQKTDHQIFLIRNSNGILLKNIKAQHIYDKEKAKTQKPLDDNRKGSVVDVENCGTVSFDGCELVGCGVYGIFAGNTEEITVRNCYLHHNSVKALCFINTKGITNVLIKNSRIVNNADFIQTEGNINVNMNENNIIENNNKQAYLNR